MNTRTKTIDTEQIKQSIDLRDYAGTYTTLRRESAKELSGPCPKCGGTKRFHVQADWFFCRDCYPLDNGKSHDVIAFVMWLDNCDFKEAVARLTNTPMPAPSTRRAPAPKAQAEQPADWQRKAKRIVERAHERLLDDNDTAAAEGRTYLEHERKLDPETWVAYKLGFIPDALLPGAWDAKKKERTHPGQPAITIPWYKGDKVVAIRYRFLKKHTYMDAEGNERIEGKSSLSGSDFKSSLFGGQALEGNIPELSAVILVEGEFNATAIRQVSLCSHLDVFSFGGQDSKLSPAMLDYIKRYASVICWLDEENRAAKVAEVLPEAHPIKSPGGKDANDLLKANMLGGFLALSRDEAAGAAGRERLLWDLYDASSGWYGCDKQTASVIRKIAKTLGKSVQLTEIREGVWRTLRSDQASPLDGVQLQLAVAQAA